MAYGRSLPKHSKRSRGRREEEAADVRKTLSK